MLELQNLFGGYGRMTILNGVSFTIPEGSITDLFWGAIESTEEAILNALVGAKMMTGGNRITTQGLDQAALVEIMTRYGRGPGSTH